MADDDQRGARTYTHCVCDRRASPRKQYTNVVARLMMITSYKIMIGYCQMSITSSDYVVLHTALVMPTGQRCAV